MYQSLLFKGQIINLHIVRVGAVDPGTESSNVLIYILSFTQISMIYLWNFEYILVCYLLFTTEKTVDWHKPNECWNFEYVLVCYLLFITELTVDWHKPNECLVDLPLLALRVISIFVSTILGL